MAAIKQLKSLSFWTHAVHKVKADAGIGPTSAYFFEQNQALTALQQSAYAPHGASGKVKYFFEAPASSSTN
jgi:hypothetical protein